MVNAYGGKIEIVKDFRIYNIIVLWWRVMVETIWHNANASKTFACMRVPIFLNNALLLNTQQELFKIL